MDVRIDVVLDPTIERDGVDELDPEQDPLDTTADGTFGETYYVSPDGSDYNPGNEVLPFETITNALSYAKEGDQIILFAGVYEERITIQESISIQGAGVSMSTIDGSGSNGVVTVQSGTVAISNLTLAHGRSDGGGCLYVETPSYVILTTVSFADCAILDPVSQNGGAIYNRGTVDASDITIVGAEAAARQGAGIYNAEGGILTVDTGSFSNLSATESGGAIYNISGHVSVTNSTFDGNAATSGGALFNTGGEATLTLETCTISTNYSYGSGAALHNDGSASADLFNCTVADNTGGGAAINNLGSVLQLRNTILSNAIVDCSGIISSLGSNITSDESCHLGVGNQESTDALLGPLFYNGGPTQTHALNEGSPAIDNADDLFCQTYDQRGVIRPQRDGCDIGAFELE